MWKSKKELREEISLLIQNKYIYITSNSIHTLLVSKKTNVLVFDEMTKEIEKLRNEIRKTKENVDFENERQINYWKNKYYDLINTLIIKEEAKNGK